MKKIILSLAIFGTLLVTINIVNAQQILSTILAEKISEVQGLSVYRIVDNTFKTTCYVIPRSIGTGVTVGKTQLASGPTDASISCVGR